MRNTSDLATAEIPGLPTWSTAPTGQRFTMQQQGYQGPKERDRCETCRFVCGGFPGHPLRCALGDFPVQRGGLCPQHLDQD